jgi:hypothetical protein
MKIILKRSFDLAYQRRKYKVLINRRLVGFIGRDESFEIDLESGDFLQVKIDAFTGSKRIYPKKDQGEMIIELSGNRGLAWAAIAGGITVLVGIALSFRIDPNIPGITIGVIMIFELLLITLFRRDWIKMKNHL